MGFISRRVLRLVELGAWKRARPARWGLSESTLSDEPISDFYPMEARGARRQCNPGDRDIPCAEIREAVFSKAGALSRKRANPPTGTGPKPTSMWEAAGRVDRFGERAPASGAWRRRRRPTGDKTSSAMPRENGTDKELNDELQETACWSALRRRRAKLRTGRGGRVGDGCEHRVPESAPHGAVTAAGRDFGTYR
jgi:hypothetical protein